MKSRAPQLVCLLIGALSIAAHAGPMKLFEVYGRNGRADAAPHDEALISQIRSRPTTASVTLIKLDIKALTEPQVSAALADKAPSTIHRKSYDKIGDNAYTWTGSVANAPGDSTIVVHDGKVTGSVRDGKRLYKIETVGDGVQALIEIDQSKRPPEEPLRRAPLAAPPPADLRPADAKRSPTSAYHDNGPIVINVAVAYTPAAQKAVGDIEGLILLAVKESNDSYTKSNVRITLNLVDKFLIAYEENSNFDAIVTDFAAMPVVSQHRASKGADLVALIMNKSDYCGLADGIQVDAAHAYAIIYQDCATGYYSFAHELGHLFGARHDLLTDNEPTPPGFSYGHGYQHPSPTLNFRTIMAYDCDPSCTRVQQWSNPNVTFQGAPTGNAKTSNNARVLNENAERVAAFRKTLVAGNLPNP